MEKELVKGVASFIGELGMESATKSRRKWA
jgi:hypothetical protein